MPSLDLLNVISQQLSLYKDKSESTEEWHGRVLYSALGKLSLASLWDSPDDWNNELSVQAFKSKIKINTEYYQQIVHSNCLYLCDSQTLANEIYSLYKKSGFIYHRANWIYPSICSSYKFGNIHIIRNGNPLKCRNMSGLGEYTSHTEQTEKVYSESEEMFSLHTVSFAKSVEEYIKDYYATLVKEGKIPAKSNMADFIEELREGHHIPNSEDAELITRFEMQNCCPDILITNYSMLEYMLFRPRESSIWDSTKKWLQEAPNNKLLFIIDEAHMYRGSAGGEVSLLIRPLWLFCT